MSGTPHVLSVNTGSTSIKLGLYRFGSGGEECRLEVVASGIGEPAGELHVGGGRDREAPAPFRAASHTEALGGVLAILERRGLPAPDAIGHRLVHGGAAHRSPERITPQLLRDLEAAVPLAPLHLPPALQAIRAAAARFPAHPQVACFDTGFHRGLPELAQRLPLPDTLWREGVRRYGFHGLSCEYVVETLGEKARGRLIIAHLGGGASLTAVRDGRPVDTSMSFTPAGGIMMGTRCGDLDPGVLLYLLRRGRSAAEVERVVEHESGLLGVSGRSADMATLLAAGGDRRAALAVDLFAYQVRKRIGAYAAVLGGLDRLVFTGGIGEHAAPVRAAACRDLEFLGVRLDPARNADGAGRISADGAPCEVLVMATDEDRMIARHTHRLLSAAS